MMTKERIISLILIMNLLLLYGSSIFFWGNSESRIFYATFFSFVGLLFSMILVMLNSRHLLVKQRMFWQIISIGLLFCTISSASTFMYFNTTTLPMQSNPSPSLLFWLLGYLFFLLALIFKTRTISNSVIERPYIFNITIFMIVITVVCVYYLVQPVITYANGSVSITLFTIVYTIVCLSNFLISTYLYYLSEKSKEKKALFILVIAFSLQLVGDVSYVYFVTNGGYQLGNMFNSLWIVSLTLIAFTSLYARENSKEITWEVKYLLEGKETFIPYFSTSLLFFLVLSSYNWQLNSLSIGLTLVFFLIIGRQLLIIRRNRELMSEYQYFAHHDILTGFRNRTKFSLDLIKAFHSAIYTQKTLALLVLDLDRFKVVNDTLGHDVGDQILIQAAARLRKISPDEARFYRIGGDEFIIILPNTDVLSCANYATKILQTLSEQFFVQYHEVKITSSIGISLYPDNGTNEDDLFKKADAAMYEAKASGKNKYCFYDHNLHEITTRKLLIEQEIRKALEKNQFQLFYQPKIELMTEKIIGMEALLRWNHPKLGFIPPDEFIPIAEETRQIVSIGEWVLREACFQNKQWQDFGLPSLCVSVNVSNLQFQSSDFVQTVSTILRESRLHPSYLELEITESIMQNVAETIQNLNKLRHLGVQTSIDDFGTGYSSLHILRALPINTLKIDKSFIDGIEDPACQPIVKTIITIGKNLNLTVVAEGIETKQQVALLKELQCDYGQGYFYLKPVPAHQFKDYILENYDRSEVVYA